jgi:hypothetical protein
MNKFWSLSNYTLPLSAIVGSKVGLKLSLPFRFSTTKES